MRTLILLCLALLPARLSEPAEGALKAASITSIVYHTSYAPSQTVSVWRGLTASIVVNGPGVTRAVEVVRQDGRTAAGLSVTVTSFRGIPNPRVVLALASTTGAALGTYKVRIHYPVLRTGSAPPDSFMVRLFDRGTINSITKDGGASELRVGIAYPFTATGSGLGSATINAAVLGPAFGKVDVTSRTATQVKFTVVPAMAASNLEISASDFFDVSMPNVTAPGPWGYAGSGRVGVSTTIVPTKIDLPSSVVENTQVPATVTMSGPVAPGASFAVALSSSSAYATVPPNAVVTGNTATFMVTVLTGAAAKSATITASSGGASANATVSVVPLVATLTGLDFPGVAAPVTLNTKTTDSRQVRVTLNTVVAGAAGETISLSAVPASAVIIPASVTVSPGQSSATFSIQANPTDVNVAVNLTAVLRGVSKTASLTVLRPVLQPIVIHSSYLANFTTAQDPGIWARRNIIQSFDLTGRAASPQVIQLSVDRPDLIPLPSSITVPGGASGQTHLSSIGATTADQRVTITASLLGQSVSRQVTVLRHPRVAALKWERPFWTSGVRLLATLDRQAPENYGFAVMNDHPDRLPVSPYPVTVMPEGQYLEVRIRTSTGFTSPTNLTGNVAEYRVTSTSDTIPAVVNVHVRAADSTTTADPGVTISLQLRPYILALGHTIGGLATAPIMTVSLNAKAPGGGAVVTLSKSGTNPGRVTIPATVTIPAGATSATYPVTIAAGQNMSGITFTATYSGVSKSVTAP